MQSDADPYLLTIMCDVIVTDDGQIGPDGAQHRYASSTGNMIEGFGAAPVDSVGVGIGTGRGGCTGRFQPDSTQRKAGSNSAADRVHLVVSLLPDEIQTRVNPFR